MADDKDSAKFDRARAASNEERGGIPMKPPVASPFQNMSIAESDSDSESDLCTEREDISAPELGPAPTRDLILLLIERTNDDDERHQNRALRSLLKTLEAATTSQQNDEAHKNAAAADVLQRVVGVVGPEVVHSLARTLSEPPVLPHVQDQAKDQANDKPSGMSRFFKTRDRPPMSAQAESRASPTATTATSAPPKSWF